ncbi:putative amidoligase enzyme-domain-containing protein [Xylaria sp. FL0064]|nr:putative amidoligase enzyme-domain-containing protein [Xylaria sp. FL0064]
MSLATEQTVGVELEFLIFYSTQEEPVSDQDSARYGPVVEVPSCLPIPTNFDWAVDDINGTLEGTWIRQKVADVIVKAGFKAKAYGQAKTQDDSFDEWSVVPDISVKLPSHFIHSYLPLKAVGVELNSPAFDAGPAAFEEITAVVKAINAAFRTAVHPCCGYHVHVGRGRAPLKLRHVQRTLSLLWLAENLLNTLHPSCRQGNMHCQDLRGASNLSEITQKHQIPKPTTFWLMQCTGVPDPTPSHSLAQDYGMQLRHPEDEPLKLDRVAAVRTVLNAPDLRRVAKIAKICLALCGSAVVESSDDDFFQLLYDCSQSENKKSNMYNVFDLLHDIGLDHKDIDVVLDRIASGRYEREPSLLFRRPDDMPNGILDESIATSWHRPYAPADWASVSRDKEWNQSGTDEGEQQPVWENGTWNSPFQINEWNQTNGEDDDQWGEPWEPNTDWESSTEDDGEWNPSARVRSDSESAPIMTPSTETNESQIRGSENNEWSATGELDEWIQYDTRMCLKEKW